ARVRALVPGVRARSARAVVAVLLVVERELGRGVDRAATAAPEVRAAAARVRDAAAAAPSRRLVRTVAVVTLARLVAGAARDDARARVDVDAAREQLEIALQRAVAAAVGMDRDHT